MCGCISHASNWEPGPQPRHLPCVGIKPATLWFAGQHSIHWAIPAKVFLFLTLLFIVDTITDVLIFSPFAHLHPALALFSLRLSPHCRLCLWVMYIGWSANPFTFFHPVPPPPSLGQLSVSIFCLFLFCSLVYFVHWIPHISEIIWWLSFSDWLISLSIIISRSIHSVTRVKSFFFMASIIPLYKWTTAFLYVIYWWTLGLFPDLGYC